MAGSVPSSVVDQGYRLGAAQTATTVRHRDGQVIITDGPFVEGGEVVGGYSIVDVPDFDRALRIARAFPACPTVRALGDFQLAEDLVQDALVVAMERWPIDRVPRRPGAWLLTVARRRGLDLLRRDASYRAKLALLEKPVQQEPDDRLRLIFTCCHPALAREAQVALTLRAVCGFGVQEIARAFLTSESAIAQRLVRARRKIARPVSRTGCPTRRDRRASRRGAGRHVPGLQRGLPDQRRRAAAAA